MHTPINPITHVTPVCNINTQLANTGQVFPHFYLNTVLARWLDRLIASKLTLEDDTEYKLLSKLKIKWTDKVKT